MSLMSEYELLNITSDDPDAIDHSTVGHHHFYKAKWVQLILYYLYFKINIKKNT